MELALDTVARTPDNNRGQFSNETPSSLAFPWENERQNHGQRVAWREHHGTVFHAHTAEHVFSLHVACQQRQGPDVIGLGDGDSVHALR